MTRINNMRVPSARSVMRLLQKTKEQRYDLSPVMHWYQLCMHLILCTMNVQSTHACF